MEDKVVVFLVTIRRRRRAEESRSSAASDMYKRQPHNLNARPLVIPDHTEIKIKVSGREEAFLASLDNRSASFPNETVLTLKKADFTIDLIELKGQSFIKTIREKLLWGEDRRNKTIK